MRTSGLSLGGTRRAHGSVSRGRTEATFNQLARLGAGGRGAAASLAPRAPAAWPTWEPFKERVNQLAFLLWVTGFILLGKSQDHGYFLMRTPPQDACALFLLREHLICREDERHGGRSKARTGSLILMALGQGGGRPVAEERARLNDSDEASDDVV